MPSIVDDGGDTSHQGMIFPGGSLVSIRLCYNLKPSYGLSIGLAIMRARTVDDPALPDELGAVVYYRGDTHPRILDI